MKNKILVDYGLFVIRAAYIRNGSLHDFLWQDNSNFHQVGDVFKGRVIKMDNSMDACLVDIGFDRPAYLGKTDMVIDGTRLKKQDYMKDVLKPGDEVIVQLIRMPIDKKGAKLSMRIEISGNYMVYFPQQIHIGFSRQISDISIINRLKSWADKKLKNEGLIFRTKSANLSEQQLELELSTLRRKWNDICAYKVLGKAPKKIYCVQNIVHRLINKYFDLDLEIVFNDSALRYDFAREIYIKNNGIDKLVDSDIKKLMDDISILHMDEIPIFEKYGVERMLKMDLSRQIKLDSGGFIVIDETESCVFIDVNSGWVLDKKNLEQTAYNTNLEATIQIARLIKVRNLSGIILVDFIDMQSNQNKNNILEKLSEQVNGDSNRVIIHGMTKLGIVEMTRKKTDISVLRKISDLDEKYFFTNLDYGGIEAVNAILRDVSLYYKHTESEVLMYGICRSGYQVVNERIELIREYIDNINVIFALDAKNNTKRIKSGNYNDLIKYSQLNYGKDYIVI